VILRVKDNTQANYGGTVYGPGETFECTRAESWLYILILGCAEEVTTPKRKRARKSK
jgi:hypothetical protein